MFALQNIPSQRKRKARRTQSHHFSGVNLLLNFGSVGQITYKHPVGPIVWGPFSQRFCQAAFHVRISWGIQNPMTWGWDFFDSIDHVPPTLFGGVWILRVDFALRDGWKKMLVIYLAKQEIDQFQ